MPNYCENDLTVVGLPETIDALLDFVRDGEQVLAFHKVVPEPEGVGDSNGQFSSWGHAWRMENWGTKWEPSGITLERSSPERLRLSFLTAWSPSTPVTRALATRLFPDLRFIHLYYERGAEYQGHDEWHLGARVAHELRPYDGPRGG